MTSRIFNELWISLASHWGMFGEIRPILCEKGRLIFLSCLGLKGWVCSRQFVMLCGMQLSSCLFLQLIWRIPSTDCSNGYQNCCYTLFAYSLYWLTAVDLSSVFQPTWTPVVANGGSKISEAWVEISFRGAVAEWAGVLGCFPKVWGKALRKSSLHGFCVASAWQGTGSQIPHPRRRCGTVQEVGVHQWPAVFLKTFLLSGLFVMNISFRF